MTQSLGLERSINKATIFFVPNMDTIIIRCTPDRADDDLQGSADDARDPREGGDLIVRGKAFQVRRAHGDTLQIQSARYSSNSPTFVAARR